MKIIFLVLIMLIFSPCYAISASFDDVKGYWLSEEDFPLTGHQVTLVITENALRHDKMKFKKFSVTQINDGFIIKFDDYKKLGDKAYNEMYDKIIILNKDKIIFETPASSGPGSRKQWTYNRITAEEAQKYLK